MIEVWISEHSATTAEVDLLVCIVRSNKKRGVFKELDKATDGMISKLAALQEFTGKAGQKLITPVWSGLQANHLLLLGTGEEADETSNDWMKLGATITRTAQQCKASVVGVVLPNKVEELAEVASSLSLGIQLTAYRFDTYKTKQDTPTELRAFELMPTGRTTARQQEEATQALARADVMAESICLARDLVNEPPNQLTPDALAQRAQEVAEDTGMACTIYDEDELLEEECRLLLAVSSGSVEPARLIHLHYKPPGRRKRKRIALVGKGVTFDSGGLSLKPTSSMLGMHADMGGAAAVLGAMKAIAQLQPNVEVHGIMAATENMTGADAYKINDIIAGRSGKTVEIKNTDAEGRLALADALSFACDQGATHIIDVATLTGACLVALGRNTAALMSNDDNMAQDLLKAAEESNESLWQLPLLEELRDTLKSSVADISNVGGRYGGAISAALFLREFVNEDTKWAHLDIAGPSFSEKDKGHIPKGGTGFAVATLTQYVLSQA